MKKAIYELKDIEHFYDEKRVLFIKKLKVEENKIIGFFGPNGSGKSTLFSLLSFINKQTNGEIYFNGFSSSKITQEIKQNIVMVPQNPYLLKRTVFENIIYGLKIRNINKDLDKKVYEALNLVGLDSSFSKRKWSQLSGGEIQRVVLASRLILKPKVLILDEPTTGVDTNSAQLIKEAILSAKQKWNTTILISSHDYNWLNHICDVRLALFQGHLVDSDSTNFLFAPWAKLDDGRLEKIFPDGQSLVIENSFEKKKDSIAIINSNDIEICREDCEEMYNENSLSGKISSIQQQTENDALLVTFSISGISFSCKVSRDEMKKQRYLPGDNIYINISTKRICWI